MTLRHGEMRRLGGRWIRAQDLYREGRLILFIRKIAATLKPNSLLSHDPPGIRAARNGGVCRDVRRIGGRWVPRDEQFSEPNAVRRMVVARCWYLLVPLIGFAWANASYVRPALENIRSCQNIERQLTLDKKDDIRAEIGELQTTIIEASAEIDTLYVPRIAYHQTILDSLLLARKVLERSPPALRVQSDSLAAFHEYLLAALEESSTTIGNHCATRASLKARHAALQDSMAELNRHIALNMAELNRREQSREQSRELYTVVSRLWYLLAPAVGMVWAHDS